MNKRRKCKHCSEYVTEWTKYLFGTFCGHECASKHAIEKMNRGTAKRRKSLEQAQKADKRRINKENLPKQLELTRMVFNNFIRLMDEGQPCISCGKHKCGYRMEAGHFKSVGSHPELRFEPRNVYLQGHGCNSATSNRKRNNLTVAKEYEVRLRDKMGDDLVDWLNGPHKAKHYTCADLIDLRQMYRDEIRYIEEHGKPSRDWRKHENKTQAEE